MTSRPGLSTDGIRTICESKGLFKKETNAIPPIKQHEWIELWMNVTFSFWSQVFKLH